MFQHIRFPSGKTKKTIIRRYLRIFSNIARGPWFYFITSKKKQQELMSWKSGQLWWQNFQQLRLRTLLKELFSALRSSYLMTFWRLFKLRSSKSQNSVVCGVRCLPHFLFYIHLVCLIQIFNLTLTKLLSTEISSFYNILVYS